MKKFKKFIILVFAANMMFLNTLQAKSNISTSGDIIQILLPSIALGTTLIVEDDYEGTTQFVKSFGSTFGTTLALKYTISEKRPTGNNRDSFPSGHTSAAFSGASFIQMRYGWEYGVPAYLAAAYVGWSRIETDKHFTHDVLAGAAIGIGFSYLFTSKYKTKNDLQITPMISNNNYGLKLSWKF